MATQEALFAAAPHHARAILDIDAYAKDHDDVIDFIESGIEGGHVLQSIKKNERGWRLRFRRTIMDSIERRRVASVTAMSLFGGDIRTRFSEIPT